MRRKLQRRTRCLLGRYAFSPSRWGIFFNPFWICRTALHIAITPHAAQAQGVVLDFGCGTGPYRNLFSQAEKYIGLEYDTPENRAHKAADIFYDGEHVPLESESIDCILSTQTLEHVPNPQSIVKEWSRVLRPGGRLLLTVPLLWPEHEMPYDFQRYTTNGIKALLHDSGFRLIHHERLVGDCRAPAQLFLAWLYDVLRLGSRSPLAQLILIITLFSPVALLASALAVITPQNANTYLDNFILAERAPQ